VGTDQLFKDILRVRAFFHDLLVVFLPHVTAAIDPDRITFLDVEVFTDVPEGARRIVDLVVRVQTRGTRPRVALIHVEVQAEREKGFGLRIARYNAMLRLRYNLPVLSIALVLYSNSAGLGFQRLAENVMGQQLTAAESWEIGPRDLDAFTYAERGPALAIGLAALMRVRRRDRVKLKARLFVRLAASGLDEARQFLLYNLIETYLPLDDEEVIALRARLRGTAVENPVLTWADRMRQEGGRTDRRARYAAAPTAHALR
jgi:hypothetical protein